MKPPVCGWRIIAGSPETEQGFSVRSLPVGRWLHLAIVLDASNRTLTGYIMGRTIGRVENVTASLERILNRNDPAANRLYIGRAQGAETPGLDAKLRDLRLYNIALSEEQIEAIVFNALGDSGRPRRIPEPRPLRSAPWLWDCRPFRISPSKPKRARCPVFRSGFPAFMKTEPRDRWSGLSGPPR